jgi:membrane peptidoglycan carboxypeptidase
MAEGYATFAADGTYCPAWPVEKVLGPDGKQLPITKPQCNDKALPDEVAHGVTFALKGVLRPGGTARGVWSGTSNVAGKTGTTDGSRDTWFVGYTRERATAVWVGDTVEPWQRTRKGKAQERRSLNGRKIGGRQYGNVYGATIAAPIWADIMRTAVRGTDTSGWDNPPASMLVGQGVPVPDVRGRSIGEALDILRGAGFDPRVGRPVDSNQPAGSVGATSPSGGELSEPGDTVIVYPSTGRGVVANAGNNPGNDDRRKPPRKRPRPPGRD